MPRHGAVVLALLSAALVAGAGAFVVQAQSAKLVSRYLQQLLS